MIMDNKKVKEQVLAALGIALVFLATYLIKVPNGIQGYFNLGDGFILLFSSLLNPFYAFLIGGIGSGLADIAGGYGIYFIPTLFIKGIEAVLVSLLLHKVTKPLLRYGIYALAGVWMVIGYFMADAFINDSWQLSLTGVPSNIIQAIVGIVIVMVTLPLLKSYQINT